MRHPTIYTRVPGLVKSFPFPAASPRMSPPDDPFRVEQDPGFPRRGPTSHFRWTIVALLCGVAMVLYVDRVNLMVAVPFMKEEFGLSETARGNVLSAFLFGYAVGLVPEKCLPDAALGTPILPDADGWVYPQETPGIGWEPDPAKRIA